MERKCIVIGGGIAGLTAASYLADKGINVTLLESSPKLGGRAYSFKLEDKNKVVDNGQHVLMGCYKDTLAFIKMIGAEKNFIYQKRLKVNFISEDGKIHCLKAAPFIYPLNLLIGFLQYKPLSFTERLSVIKFMLSLPFTSHQSLSKKSVKEWLTEKGGNENVIKCLWEMLAVGALNTNIEKASAVIFHNILMQIFYGGNFATTIILPKYGLTESYVNDARKFIESRGGETILSNRVEKIIIENNSIKKIVTSKQVYNDFDFVIAALPPYAVQKLVPADLINGKIDFTYSSILNVHFWLRDNPFSEEFYGLLNSPVHWIFNKHSHINLVISDADYLIEKSNDEIIAICSGELQKYCGITRGDITGYKILKEKRATIIPSVDSVFSRPSNNTKLKNLFLAGDWTDTGLPSTIESAAKSGRTAAEIALS